MSSQGTLKHHSGMALLSLVAYLLWTVAVLCTCHTTTSHGLDIAGGDGGSDVAIPIVTAAGSAGWAQLGVLLLMLCGPLVQRFGLSDQGWEALDMHCLLSTFALPALLVLLFPTLFCSDTLQVGVCVYSVSVCICLYVYVPVKQMSLGVTICMRYVSLCECVCGEEERVVERRKARFSIATWNDMK
jgi:hypothetical protein